LIGVLGVKHIGRDRADTIAAVEKAGGTVKILAPAKKDEGEAA